MLELTRVNLIICSKKYNFDIKTLSYVNILEFLRFELCVQHCRHIETHTYHVVTGAYITNQSTNGGVRQHGSQ